MYHSSSSKTLYGVSLGQGEHILLTSNENLKDSTKHLKIRTIQNTVKLLKIDQKRGVAGFARLLLQRIVKQGLSRLAVIQGGQLF
jgi:hypothetical protein